MLHICSRQAFRRTNKSLQSCSGRTERDEAKKIKPGTTGGQVYDVGRQVIEKSGYIKYLGPAFGHGHTGGPNDVNVSKNNAVQLRAGMYLTLHPSIYVFGSGVACILGEPSLVTDRGYETLWSTTKLVKRMTS